VSLAPASAPRTASKPPARSLRAFKALRDPKMMAMLLLALAAGLPYGAILGTLNAWLTADGVTPSTIGVLSFIILAYAYKFIWAPGFQKAWFPKIGIPGLSRLGPRRAWLLVFQLLMAALLGLLAMSHPASAIGYVALIGLAIAVSSATHDIVLDAWRIEVAKTEEDVDLMSALYQFGYRFASLLTGAVALVLAQRIGWPLTYGLIAVAMALATVGTFIAPEPEALERDGQRGDGRPTYSAGIDEGTKRIAVGIVMACWAVAIFMIVSFVAGYLLAETPPNANVFIREQGPAIILLSVLVPGIVSAWLLRENPMAAAHAGSGGSRLDRAADTLFHVALDPLMDLVQRLRWSVILVVALVLMYRFADLIWGSFAYPFYLGTENGALGHTNDEVAIASKTIGVVMIMIGSGAGAAALLFLGRMPCLVIGALLAAVTNLQFADLASGGGGMTAFLSATGLGGPLEAAGGWTSSLLSGQSVDPERSARLARLIAAIAAENLAVGFASVAAMAFLTSIVNPKFAAVQYALLASLTMLIGTLGRAPLGEMIEARGFADVFVLTFWIGLVAVALSAAEWARQLFAGKPVDLAQAQPAPAE